MIVVESIFSLYVVQITIPCGNFVPQNSSSNIFADQFTYRELFVIPLSDEQNSFQLGKSQNIIPFFCNLKNIFRSVFEV